MLMSLLLVALLFDSSCVEQISADWSEGFQFHCKDTFKPRSSPLWSLMRSFSGNVDPKNDSAAPAVLPSQGIGIYNHRIVAGNAPWEEAPDVETGNRSLAAS